MTPTDTGTVHRGISGPERVIFQNSSHMPHLEESERYLEVLEQFPDRVESQAEPDWQRNVVDAGSS